MKRILAGITLSLLCLTTVRADEPTFEHQTIYFHEGDLTLGGELYKPKGDGPFPAVLFNHGSAGGMLSQQAAQALGPNFTKKGWVFFMPYRRGQGLSEKAGPYIEDLIKAAEKQGGTAEGEKVMLAQLQHEHLDDQLAALQWLSAQPFTKPGQIAVAGVSFGGIEAVLGAARASYCATIDAAGGAMSWDEAPVLQAVMKASVRNAKSPIFFMQAENDFNLSPSKVLAAEMQSAGKEHELHIYPRFGKSAMNGHIFGYFGSGVWLDDVTAFLSKHCVSAAGA
jgi:dienelactone hydrolase